MFDLLNDEIREYQARNNKNCDIYIGRETYKNIKRFYLPVEPTFSIKDLESIGLCSQYLGLKMYEADFDYGYYLK